MLLSCVTVLVGGLVACTAAPGKPIELNDIPGVQLSGSGVSASYGGYHASAGLGGSLNGGPAGGLYAQAGTADGTSASAGLAGSAGSGGSGGALYSQAQFGNGADSNAKSSAGTVIQGPPQKKLPNDFYDNVFNIPISVLQAVNQLLGGTPKHEATKVVHTRIYTRANSGSSAETGGDINVSKSVPERTFFDNIFNIPISALKSVNDLLNSKNGSQKSSVDPYNTQ